MRVAPMSRRFSCAVLVDSLDSHDFGLLMSVFFWGLNQGASVFFWRSILLWVCFQKLCMKFTMNPCWPDWMTHPTYSAVIEAWSCHSTILIYFVLPSRRTHQLGRWIRINPSDSTTVDVHFTRGAWSVSNLHVCIHIYNCIDTVHISIQAALLGFHFNWRFE